MNGSKRVCYFEASITSVCNTGTISIMEIAEGFLIEPTEIQHTTLRNPGPVIKTRIPNVKSSSSSSFIQDGLTGAKLGQTVS